MTNCNDAPTPVALQLNPEVTAAGNQDYTRAWRTVSTLLTNLQTALFNLQTCVNSITGGATPSASVTAVGPSSVVGVSPDYSRGDHIHAGVSDVGGATGSITVGTGLSLTGNTLSALGSGIGSTPPTTITVAASPYAPVTADFLIFANTTGGPITVNLPSAAALPGRIIIVENTGTINTVTVSGATGITSIVNTTGFTSVWYISDGSNWFSFSNSQGN